MEEGEGRKNNLRAISRPGGASPLQALTTVTLLVVKRALSERLSTVATSTLRMTQPRLLTLKDPTLSV